MNYLMALMCSRPAQAYQSLAWPGLFPPLLPARSTLLGEKRLHQGHPLVVTMLNTNVITRVPWNYPSSSTPM
ncbi:hypothetical protein MTR_7g035270 [Medicago truncatula]|uniref:Uncharacterized protein n=1 Tax=Medicago truncatula TaxID=3880 RepID=A0A072TZE7_MEDTR|nr:hypothetical protein MTR_7g035270 [Medicago truncatula]